MQRAAFNLGAPRLLAASAAPASITGTLTETALATIPIPARAMGTSGGLLIVTTWSITNSANTKTVRVRLGGMAGTAFLNAGLTTAACLVDERRIKNRGAANSQVCSFSASAGVLTSSGAVVTGAVDTAVAQDLSITGQNGNVGETITLEAYEVWILP